MRQEKVRVQMKVCECCGGFWLRPSGSSNIYCRRCAPVMAEIPTVALPDAGDEGGHN